MRTLKLQSAMEYLMTYSWALLVVALVVATIFALGLFNPGAFVGTQCVLPAGLACTTVYIVSNGVLTLNFQQVTLNPINLSAFGCNRNQTVAHMQIPFNPPTNQIQMQVGANYTFSVQCWAGASKFSSAPGGIFQGYVFVNYTEVNTGFPHTVPGQLTLKVT